LAAEILHHSHEHPTTGGAKLQKLIHLCEYVAEIDGARKAQRGEAYKDAGRSYPIILGFSTGDGKSIYFFL
jgi:hypothetical protein